MSKRSRERKNKARVSQELLEQPETEQLQTERPQTERPETEQPQTEEPWPEELWSEELWSEDFWPEEERQEETQLEGAQPEEVPPKKAQTENGQPEKNQPEKAGPKKKQRIVMAVTIALAVVAVIATALVLLHNRWFKKPTLPPAPTQSVSGSIPSTAAPSLDPGQSQNPDPAATQEIVTVQPLAGGNRKSKDFYTILIFGADQISGLTDTIMVASYDVTNQKATVLSIPRDTLVNNYYLSKGNKSINATYKQNGKGETGVAALKTEVSRLIGFVPDFYVTIDWDLVGKMVDAIGGVYFDIPWHMGYDDPTQDLHIHFEAGYQYLDGKDAMNLVRWRKNNDGKAGGGSGSDLNRLSVQHDFLKEVLKQTLQPQNIVRIPELIRLFNENVVSDLAVENMLWFGQEAVLGGLTADDVEFVTMPVYGTSNSSGRYYGKVCAITNQLLTLVNSSLNPYVEDVTLRQLDLIQMSSDGNVLSSTTGTLRNTASGVYTYPNAPTTSEPPEDAPLTPDPAESDPITPDPAESDPITPDPAESDPVTPDPAESDPVTPDPAESDPGPIQTDDPPPEPGAAETGGGAAGEDPDDTLEQPDT